MDDDFDDAPDGCSYLSAAKAIYAALNNGRVPDDAFFLTPATGGADYLRAAEEAVSIGEDIPPSPRAEIVPAAIANAFNPASWKRFNLG